MAIQNNLISKPRRSAQAVSMRLLMACQAVPWYDGPVSTNQWLRQYPSLQPFSQLYLASMA